MPEDRLIKLATFATIVEAHLAKGKLASEGIEAFILDENIVGMNWLYSAAVGGAKLHVHESDFKQARAILSQTPDDFSLPEVTKPAPIAPQLTFWQFCLNKIKFIFNKR